MAHGIDQLSEEAKSSFASFGGVKGAAIVGKPSVVPDSKKHAVRIEIQQKFAVRLPAGLGEKVNFVSAFVTHAIDVSGMGLAGDWRLHSSAVVLMFRKPQRGISGLPVRPYDAKKYGHLEFSHVAVCRRKGGWAIEFYGRPWDRIGYTTPLVLVRFWDARDVLKLDDELCALQWLYENGAEGLLDIPALASWGLLPKTDRERDRENMLAKLFASDLDRPRPPLSFREELTYHKFRLRKRFKEIAVGRKTFDPFAAYNRTRIGSRTAEQLAFDVLSRSFHWSERDGVGVARYGFSSGEYDVRVDAATRQFVFEPVKTSVDGETRSLDPAAFPAVSMEEFRGKFDRVFPLYR